MSAGGFVRKFYPRERFPSLKEGESDFDNLIDQTDHGDHHRRSRDRMHDVSLCTLGLPLLDEITEVHVSKRRRIILETPAKMNQSKRPRRRKMLRELSRLNIINHSYFSYRSLHV